MKQLASAAARHGVWRDALQHPPHYAPELRAAPWHDARDFWFTALLRDNAARIRAEYLARAVERDRWDGAGAAPSRGVALTEVGGRSGFGHDGFLCTRGSWREAVFHGAGVRHAETCERFPFTASLIDRITEATSAARVGCGEVLFAVLSPGSRLRPHCGSTNARLTCHFGVRIPPGAKIRAGEETRAWTEGDCVVFDDSFEHEVWHEGDADEGPRVIILLNFWHPDFPEEMRTPQWRELSDPGASRYGATHLS